MLLIMFEVYFSSFHLFFALCVWSTKQKRKRRKFDFSEQNTKNLFLTHYLSHTFNIIYISSPFCHWINKPSVENKISFCVSSVSKRFPVKNFFVWYSYFRLWVSKSSRIIFQKKNKNLCVRSEYWDINMDMFVLNINGIFFPHSFLYRISFAHRFHITRCEYFPDSLLVFYYSLNLHFKVKRRSLSCEKCAFRSYLPRYGHHIWQRFWF